MAMENNQDIKVNDGVAVDFTNVAPQIVARPGRTPRVKPAEMSISTLAETTQTAIAVAEPIVAELPSVMAQNAPVAESTHNVTLKTFPVHDAIVQVLSIDDTPFLRAEKIQAMADAARAHAKLFELGVMNNQFLLTNDSKISNVEVGALEKGRIEAEKARTEARVHMDATSKDAQAQVDALRAELKNELLRAKKSGTKKMLLGIGITTLVLAAAGAIAYFAWIA